MIEREKVEKEFEWQTREKISRQEVKFDEETPEKFEESDKETDKDF